MFFKANSAASREENPNWCEATIVVFADNYCKSMKVDIDILESMGAWEIIDRDEYINIIDSTWDFKCKKYPDGLIKKFKARLCGRVNQQLEVIDFFETYGPVVKCTTI